MKVLVCFQAKIKELKQKIAALEKEIEELKEQIKQRDKTIEDMAAEHKKMVGKKGVICK